MCMLLGSGSIEAQSHLLAFLTLGLRTSIELTVHVPRSVRCQEHAWLLTIALKIRLSLWQWIRLVILARSLVDIGFSAREWALRSSRLRRLRCALPCACAINPLQKSLAIPSFRTTIVVPAKKLCLKAISHSIRGVHSPFAYFVPAGILLRLGGPFDCSSAALTIERRSKALCRTFILFSRVPGIVDCVPAFIRLYRRQGQGQRRRWGIFPLEKATG